MPSIAIIDDDPAMASQIEALLAREGHRTRVYHNGLSGVTAVMGAPPDLVCCDVEMPGWGGFDVLLRLREFDDTAAIPFVFVTSYADEAFRRRAQGAGADGYVDKAHLVRDLVPMVRGQLSRADHTHLLAARLFRQS